MGRDVLGAMTDDDPPVTIRGRVQMIAGKLSIVGKPSSWETGFDDWEIREGDEITLTVPADRLMKR